MFVIGDRAYGVEDELHHLHANTPLAERRKGE